MTRRLYAAGVAVLVALLLSSAVGAQVEWVDVGGNVNEAAPQALQAPAGAVLASPVAVNATPPEQGSADGMPLDYVYIDPANYGTTVLPWYPTYSGVRQQQLYLASEIGRSGTIGQIALFKTNNTNKSTFPNVSIKLCHTNVTSLGTTFADNYDGNSPVWVFHQDAGFTRGTGVSNSWDLLDLQTNFNYNGTDNLLVEVVWQGTASGFYSGSRYNVGSGNRRAYAYNITDTLQPTASSVENYLLNTCIGFIPPDNDFGVTSILSPTDPHYAFGDNISPRAVVKNFGELPQTDVPVRCIMKNKTTGIEVYNQVVTVDLASGQVATVDFPSYAPAGMHSPHVNGMRTELPGDERPDNDALANEFKVTEWGGGWLTYNDQTFENGISWISAGNELATRFEAPRPLAIDKVVVWLSSFSGADYPSEVRLYGNDGTPYGYPGTQIVAWAWDLSTSIWTSMYKNEVYLDPPIVVPYNTFYVSYYQTSIDPHYPFLGMDYNGPITQGNDWGKYQGSWGLHGYDKTADFGLELCYEATGADFGSIAGTIFNDKDDDGIRDPGELGLPEWTVQLLPGPIYTLTDGDGGYLFDNLAPGEYTVSEVVQPYWVQTYPPPPGVHAVTVGDGEDVTGKDFGNKYNLGSIAGTAFNDANGNDEHDPGEQGLPGWTVKLMPGSRYTQTDATGAYLFRSLSAGEYVVSEAVEKYWQQTYPPPPGVHVVTLDEAEDVTGKDFGNRTDVYTQDLAVSVAGGIARPGFEKDYAVSYRNAGTVEVDATVTLALPEEVSYVSSSHSGIYSVATHSVIWPVGALPPSFEGYLSAIVRIAVVPIGTELTASATIEPLEGDEWPSDNRDIEIEVVQGSYDPNMITVRPEPYIEAGDVLDCTIYFQNVGNDTAFNIVVRDVLDPGLDVATVEPLAASHPYAFGLGEPNELTWWFNDIKLVDSITNEPASNGFLRFRIHTYANLTPGTHVDNSAAIYFDYNEPVQTNTVQLTVVIWGWSARASMPLPPSNEEVDAGGWLAYDPGSQFIYGPKGNKTADFYRYDPTGDVWQTLAPWPDGSERNKPSDGSAGCAADDGIIYATKGSNTPGFWMYDAAEDAWYQKADVPPGPDSLKAKGGTDIVWVGSSATGHAYLLKGHKNEFYRYHPDGDYWETLADAPSGPNRKWDKGSWLAYDGDNTIYAHRADYNELYAYDVASGTWSAPLAGMPFVGRSGKNQKSGDGGCGTYLDGCIYALKGGKTQECWKYTIATNSWFEEGSMSLGPQDKTVGPGADIVAAGAKLLATKGNKCNELWQYLSASFNPGSSPSEGTQAVETAVAPGMSISPNPLASGFAVLRYGLPKGGVAELSVYNVAGQRVMTKALVLGRSGSVSLDLRQLAGGVYVLKLRSDACNLTRKVVIE